MHALKRLIPCYSLLLFLPAPEGSCIQVTDTLPGDYDFWMIVPKHTEYGDRCTDEARQQRADELLEQTLNALNKVAGYHDCLAVFKPSCVTWLLLKSIERIVPGQGTQQLKEQAAELKVQIINRLYETPAQVYLRTYLGRKLLAHRSTMLYEQSSGSHAYMCIQRNWLCWGHCGTSTLIG